MSPAHWEAWERREQGALGGQPDTDTRQTLPGSRACHPVPLTAHFSPETILVPVSGRGWAALPHRFLTCWDCVPTLTLAGAWRHAQAPSTQNGCTDNPPPGAAWRLNRDASRCSTCERGPPQAPRGPTQPRRRLHTHAPNRQRTAGQTEAKDSSLFTPHVLCSRPYASAGRVAARARAPAKGLQALDHADRPGAALA